MPGSMGLETFWEMWDPWRCGLCRDGRGTHRSRPVWGRQVIQGGSHGGSLAALRKFQASISFPADPIPWQSLAPTCSARQSCATSRFLHLGPPYEGGTYATPDSFVMLHAASSIAHIHRVKMPVYIIRRWRSPCAANARRGALKGRGCGGDVGVTGRNTSDRLCGGHKGIVQGWPGLVYQTSSARKLRHRWLLCRYLAKSIIFTPSLL